MKILFIGTNIRTYHPFEIFPMGIGALSAFMKQRGHSVEVFTAFKMSEFGKLDKVLRRFQPDLVGYSVISCQSPYIPDLTARVKRWNPSVPVICGGAHPTLAPEEVLSHPGVDAVCISDGEYALEEYVNALDSGTLDYDIRGIWFKKPDGTLVENELREFIQDLDELPFLDRSCVDYQNILNYNGGMLWVLASRGCAWTCTFCSIAKLKDLGKGEYMRNRSVDHVIEELRELFRNYRFRVVVFRDDTFTWDREWALEFLDRYAEEFAFPFSCFSRADCLDEELAKALKRAGCHSVWLGYESGNEYIRNEIIKKEIGTEEFVDVCDTLNRNGVMPIVLNMVGVPHETREAFADTIEVNRRIHKDYPIFALTSGLSGPKIFTFEPLPGTPLHDMCSENQWVHAIDRGFRAHVDSYVAIPTFPAKDVLREYRRFRYNIYKDDHRLLANFYRLYDSGPGDFLRRNLPSRPFSFMVRLAMRKHSP